MILTEGTHEYPIFSENVPRMSLYSFHSDNINEGRVINYDKLH